METQSNFFRHKRIQGKSRSLTVETRVLLSQSIFLRARIVERRTPRS